MTRKRADVLVTQFRYCAVRQSTYRPLRTTPHFWTTACCFDGCGRIELMRGKVTDACGAEERLVVNEGRRPRPWRGVVVFGHLGTGRRCGWPHGSPVGVTLEGRKRTEWWYFGFLLSGCVQSTPTMVPLSATG